MSSLDLDAIEARAAAATPGPWKPERDPDPYVGNVWFDERPGHPVESRSRECAVAVTVTEPDAAFIAAARTDVVALCAEVRRLREALSAFQEALNRWSFYSEACSEGLPETALDAKLERAWAATRAAWVFGRKPTAELPAPEKGRLRVTRDGVDIDPEEWLHGPDLDLLRKFATGEGGRRTGELMRAGLIHVEITPAGMAALEAER